MKHLKSQSALVALLSGSILLSSCGAWQNANRTERGAAIGVGGGAAAGAAIGRATGNTALGALLGAVVGGGAGAIIGRQMDKQAEDIKTQIPDAKVERVNEGITVEFSSKVLFGFDSYSLTDASKGSLNKLVTVLNTYPNTNIEVQGYTDNTGTEQYNQDLSVKRASSVANYLVGNGISSGRVKTIGYGWNNPKYDNSTAEGRTENRRVEFVIYANQQMQQDAKTQANNGR